MTKGTWNHWQTILINIINIVVMLVMIVADGVDPRKQTISMKAMATWCHGEQWG
jgi:hypothetical protein